MWGTGGWVGFGAHSSNYPKPEEQLRAAVEAGDCSKAPIRRENEGNNGIIAWMMCLLHLRLHDINSCSQCWYCCTFVYDEIWLWISLQTLQLLFFFSLYAFKLIWSQDFSKIRWKIRIKVLNLSNQTMSETYFRFSDKVRRSKKISVYANVHGFTAFRFVKNSPASPLIVFI